VLVHATIIGGIQPGRKSREIALRHTDTSLKTHYFP
jgi:hypothetical protein